MDIAPVDTAERLARARAVLTIAFVDDPVTRWTLPTPADHLQGWPRMIDAMGRDAFAADTAWIAGDDLGAIVWVPPGSGVDEEAMVAATRDHVPTALHEQLQEFVGRLDEFHPRHDHWFLPLLGVDPGRRGLGIGSTLLEKTLSRVDADHADAFLTSSNPRNITLYRRYGFEVLGEVQVGSSPVMTPMLRPAAGRQAAGVSVNPS